MDKPTPSNVSGASAEPTVASILGIKGPLRFHPHGSTQKAHVVLRQVQLPEDSDDEGDTSVIYFSLFAQKRIEVKPGKEILLAVAAPDGKLLDTPVVLAGRLSNGSFDSDVDSSTPRPKVTITPSFLESTVPPKMRKPWSKLPPTNHMHPLASSSRSFASVGVQAEPEVVSKAVDSTSFPPPASTTDTLREKTELPSKGTQTLGQHEADVHGPSTIQDDLEHRRTSSRRERSLSPMELDSTPSSPATSPTLPTPSLPATSQERLKSASFSPPGLWVSLTSPASPPSRSEAVISPPQMSPENDDPPGLSSLPSGPNAPHTKTSKSRFSHAMPMTRLENIKSPSPMSTESLTSRTVAPSSSISGETHRITESWKSSGDLQPPASKQEAQTPVPLPYVPRRKLVPNPFVSGGLLTDFVGSSKPQPEQTAPLRSQKATNDEEANQAAPSSVPAPTNASGTATPPTFDQSSTVQKKFCSPPAVSEHVSPPVSRTPSRTQSPSASTQASASSSKVKVEDVPVPAPSGGVDRPPVQHPTPRSPTASRWSGRQIISRRYSYVTPPPNLDRQWGGQTRNPSPPPDPKSLAYIPSGSFSNPLNIRPSGMNGWNQGRGHHKPNFPPTEQTQNLPAAPKKPVAIGSGWAPKRQANGNGMKRQFIRKTSQDASSLQPAMQPVTPLQNQNGSSSSNAVPLSPSGIDESVFMAVHDDAAPTDAMTNPPSLASRLSSGFLYDNGLPPPVPQPKTPVRAESQEIYSPQASPYSPSLPSPVASRLPPGAFPHPLPAKPVAFSGSAPGAYSPTHGVKRMASPVGQPSAPESRRQKTFKWPTSQGMHSVHVKGEGDVGVRTITHNSDGTMFALTCYDKSVRIWNNKNHTEIAKLAHNMQVTAVSWMERDAGVVTMGENGIVSTWTRSAQNKWQWAKILDVSRDRRLDDDPSCLAFFRDRIAIASPRFGVKVWLFIKGTWLPQRAILRQNVTALKFIEDGEAMIGGTTDGVLWYCQVPNGTLRAYTFMKSKVSTLDMDPKGTHVLAAQAGGRAHLVNVSGEDDKGKVEKIYATQDPDYENDLSYDFGALFANRGVYLLFGNVRGCIMVWDRSSGDIVHGLHHGDDNSIPAVANFDGNHATEGHVLTGSRQGLLTWFSQPPVESSQDVSWP